MSSFSSSLLGLFSLAALACSAESAPPPASATGEPRPESATPPAPPQSAPPASPQRELREPTFDFAPGGPVSDAQLGDYHVVLSAQVDGEEVGTMTFDLWPEAAPITARNFLRLCDVGFYDGLTFHRILREFMVQGGDPTGTGGGDSPFGTIQAEFSDAPERAHGYGVLSMARKGGVPDSASCQFFVCCDESPGVWNLDGQYASFGRLTGGVATLEALAEVPVRPGGMGEPSSPTKRVVITRAEVKKGPAPTGETIARPVPDLGGEPARVKVQHVLIAFQGVQQIQSERSKEDAEALAQQVLERARAGEDFTAMVRELSDDKAKPEDETPGVYLLRNRGVRDVDAERALFRADRAAAQEMQELAARVQKGEATAEELQARREALVAELTAAFAAIGTAREEMVPGFGDVAFGLEVGEVGLAPYDAAKAPFGWHVIRRIE